MYLKIKELNKPEKPNKRQVAFEPMSPKLSEEAIELKRLVSIKFADAVIAATALLNNLKLATRNVDDYKAVKNLKMFNHFA